MEMRRGGHVYGDVCQTHLLVSLVARHLDVDLYLSPLLVNGILHGDSVLSRCLRLVKGSVGDLDDDVLPPHLLANGLVVLSHLLVPRVPLGYYPYLKQQEALFYCTVLPFRLTQLQAVQSSAVPPLSSSLSRPKQEDVFICQPKFQGLT
jgi:hypothetical protein